MKTRIAGVLLGILLGISWSGAGYACSCGMNFFPGSARILSSDLIIVARIKQVKPSTRRAPLQSERLRTQTAMLEPICVLRGTLPGAGEIQVDSWFPDVWLNSEFVPNERIFLLGKSGGRYQVLQAVVVREESLRAIREVWPEGRSVLRLTAPEYPPFPEFLLSEYEDENHDRLYGKVSRTAPVAKKGYLLFLSAVIGLTLFVLARRRGASRREIARKGVVPLLILTLILVPWIMLNQGIHIMVMPAPGDPEVSISCHQGWAKELRSDVFYEFFIKTPPAPPENPWARPEATGTRFPRDISDFVRYVASPFYLLASRRDPELIAVLGTGERIPYRLYP